MRALARTFALCGLIPTLAVGRPVTVDDLLHLEELGPTVIDPSGRWAVIETEIPFDRSSRFEDWPFSRTIRAHLELVDLKAPSQARLAFPQDDKAAYIAGPFSPSGRAMLVFRDIDRRREAGVLTLATGQIHWLGVGAEMADEGATSVWRSETEILLLALSPQERPFLDKAQVAAMLDLPGLWSSALQGSNSTTVTNGSGRYRDIHPKDPDRRLLKINAVTGEASELASGPFESLSLSKSGGKVALIEALERIQPDPHGLIGPGYEWRRHNVRLLDLSSGEAIRPCPDCDVMPASLRWSNKDDLLLFSRAPDQPWSTGSFLRLDRNSVDARPIETFGVKPHITYLIYMFTADAHADWMGDEPVIYGANTKASDRADWYRLTRHGALKLTTALPSPPAAIEALTDKSMLLIDKETVWAVSRDGGARAMLQGPGLARLRQITAYASYQADQRQPSANSTALVSFSSPTTLTAAEVGVDGVKWRINAPIPSAGPSSTRSALLGPFKPLNASPQGFITSARDPHGVEDIVVARPDQGATTVRVLNSQFSKIEAAQPIEITAPGPHGEPYKDYLYLPPDAKPGIRYPVVIIAYPAANQTSPPYQGLPAILPLVDNVQLVAAQGYAVLYPSIPIDNSRPDFSGDMTKLTLAALDRAAATGLIDPNAAAFWGHSAGGYMGYVLATQTDRFKAIITEAATADYLSSYGQSRPSHWTGSILPNGFAFPQGWAELGQGHTMATPWTNLDRYIKASPVFAADKINTPLFIAQGDQDAVSFAQGQEMFAALYRLRKDALFMAAFGEGHEIMSPPNARTFYGAAFKFLDANLRKGVGP